MGRIAIFIVGLALLSLVYVAAIHFRAEKIEGDLRDRSNLALVVHDISWATVSINGRDVILEGTAPDIESVKQTKEAIMSVWGIRMVACRCKVSTETDKTTDPIENSPIETRKTPVMASSQPVPTLAESKLISNEAVTRSVEENNTLPAQCQNDINTLLEGQNIEFASGSSSISTESFSLLKKLIIITIECPDSHFEIAGHTDNIGNEGKNSILSLNRAQAVVDYLQAAGIPKDRLSAAGYGASLPVDSNETDEGRRRNRRIEFHIRP